MTLCHGNFSLRQAPKTTARKHRLRLNAVEGFFAKLTRRRLKYGIFHSVVDLQAAINRFIKEHNAKDARPFTWRANPNDIIKARNRGYQMLESLH